MNSFWGSLSFFNSYMEASENLHVPDLRIYLLNWCINVYVWLLWDNINHRFFCVGRISRPEVIIDRYAAAHMSHHTQRWRTTWTKSICSEHNCHVWGQARHLPLPPLNVLVKALIYHENRIYGTSKNEFGKSPGVKQWLPERGYKQEKHALQPPWHSG